MARLHERLRKLEGMDVSGVPPLVLRMGMGQPIARFVDPTSLGWSDEPDPGPLHRQEGESEEDFVARAVEWASGLGVRVIMGSGTRC
jgi:hypothetical protein